MPITWDSQADAKLLIGIVESSTINYQSVADFMGDGCTVSAVKHRVQRLRERASHAGSGKTSTNPPKSPSTPKTKRSTSIKVSKAKPKQKVADSKTANGIPREKDDLKSESDKDAYV
ncbi:hypothetical protein N7450_005066 [Penicillium hetheringtonii]|uniref:Uncharacterized protein n=1 Tax=Penicillium hetheringtonii TaxID=911720 RepID=A0AAD6DR78_9EURO|nr:hypothetical protein N7450_005066 [Penicillium hetheringtonii]